jgi:hypothetical protein
LVSKGPKGPRETPVLKASGALKASAAAKATAAHKVSEEQLARR